MIIYDGGVAFSSVVCEVLLAWLKIEWKVKIGKQAVEIGPSRVQNARFLLLTHFFHPYLSCFYSPSIKGWLSCLSTNLQSLMLKGKRSSDGLVRHIHKLAQLMIAYAAIAPPNTSHCSQKLINPKYYQGPVISGSGHIGLGQVGIHSCVEKVLYFARRFGRMRLRFCFRGVVYFTVLMLDL
jgi:hypothetical protein